MLFGWLSPFHLHLSLSLHLFSFFSHFMSLFSHYVFTLPATSFLCQICLSLLSRPFLSPSLPPACEPQLWPPLILLSGLCLSFTGSCALELAGSGSLLSVWDRKWGWAGLGWPWAACPWLCLWASNLSSHISKCETWPLHAASTYQSAYLNISSYRPLSSRPTRPTCQHSQSQSCCRSFWRNSTVW